MLIKRKWEEEEDEVKSGVLREKDSEDRCGTHGPDLLSQVTACEVSWKSCEIPVGLLVGGAVCVEGTVL